MLWLHQKVRMLSWTAIIPISFLVDNGTIRKFVVRWPYVRNLEKLISHRKLQQVIWDLFYAVCCQMFVWRNDFCFYNLDFFSHNDCTCIYWKRMTLKCYVYNVYGYTNKCSIQVYDDFMFSKALSIQIAKTSSISMKIFTYLNCYNCDLVMWVDSKVCIISSQVLLPWEKC